VTDEILLSTPSAFYFEPVLELLSRLMDAYHNESEAAKDD